MQTDEERKARMRDYYRKNKDKWKKYNRDRLTRMSEDERESYRERQKVLSREYYEAHRAEVIERTSQYQKEHREELVPYRAKYFQENKTQIRERQNKHYHAVVKDRKRKAMETSEFVSISEAVAILGAKLRGFRELVYRGEFEAHRTAGGRYKLRRADVLDLQRNIRHLPENVRRSLGLQWKGECNERS